jgi:hypothetical protein
MYNSIPVPKHHPSWFASNFATTGKSYRFTRTIGACSDSGYFLKFISGEGVEKSMTDDLKVKASKAVDDANVAAHAGYDDASVAVHNTLKDAGDAAHNASDDAKIATHKAVADAKIAVHKAGSEMKKK